MTINVGINGFGRMGRLALRAAWDWPELSFTHINDPAGDAITLAHLLNFDSVHGRWQHEAKAEGDDIVIGGISGGFSSQYGLVLAARVMEGLAAGVVQPIPAIIILRAFAKNEQGRASGIFGMGVVLAPAIGPSIGGVLVDLFGWRSIFFMVVPFCLTSMWLAYKFVPITAPGGVTADKKGPALDWRGLTLASVGTLCLLNGLVELHGAGARCLRWAW